jgi:hypothetical protein
MNNIKRRRISAYHVRLALKNLHGQGWTTNTFRQPVYNKAEREAGYHSVLYGGIALRDDVRISMLINANDPTRVKVCMSKPPAARGRRRRQVEADVSPVMLEHALDRIREVSDMEPAGNVFTEENFNTAMAFEAEGLLSTDETVIVHATTPY